MISMLLGMLGAALMLLAFRLGMKVGERRPCPGAVVPEWGRTPVEDESSAAQPKESGRKETEEDDQRRAFEQLMGYNAEAAYGMHKGVSEDV